MDQLMPIGEFSALCQLSVKMLRHYDEIGLLVPARVEPVTGYRYYSLDQSRSAATIRELRALDMPLGEIRAVIDAGDADRVRALLSCHRERLVGQLAAAERRIELVEQLIGEERDMIEHIREVEVPAARMTTRRVEGPTGMFVPLMTAAFADLFTTMQRHGVVHVGPPTQIVHHGDEDRFEHEACYPVDPAADVPARIPVRDLPSVRAAVLRHAGPLDEGNVVVHRVFDWLRERGEQPAMPFRVALLAMPPLFALPEFADATEPVYELGVPFRPSSET